MAEDGDIRLSGALHRFPRTRAAPARLSSQVLAPAAQVADRGPSHQAQVHLLVRHGEVVSFLRLGQRGGVHGRSAPANLLGNAHVFGQREHLRLVEMDDRLEVNGAAVMFLQKALIVLQRLGMLATA